MSSLVRLATVFIFCATILTSTSSAHPEYFIRAAKWSHLSPSGGALVSGRGNFRPGFNSRLWSSMIAEPSFNKRSFNSKSDEEPKRYSLNAPIEAILSSVIRQSSVPDTLLPTVCPPSCDELFHAIDASGLSNTGLNTSISESCSCVCPEDQPVYLNTAGYCVNKLDECRHNIPFESSHITEKYLPVVTLPAHNGVVLPRTKILWKESGIEVSPTGAVNCSITGVYHENISHRWRPASKKHLFNLLTAGGQTVIMFRGSDHDANHLVGAVVQLKVSCARFLADEHCLSFRVAGVSGNNPYKNGDENRNPEVGITLLLVGLLILTLLGTFFIWQMCWRRKKQQLISDIQMQFLYHFKQQQEAHKAAVAAAQMSRGGISSPNEFSPRDQMSPTSSDYSSPLSPTESTGQKKRLFFSAEYLDRDYMENPPAMAEQFLYDLRRMIDVARDRIRMRRFVPMLIAIPELPEEGKYSIGDRKIHPCAIIEENPMESSMESQESPRSEPKSIDSGRESREDSDDSRDIEEDEEDDITQEVDNNNKQLNIETVVRKDSVKKIVSGFESLSSSNNSFNGSHQNKPASPTSKLPTPSKPTSRPSNVQKPQGSTPGTPAPHPKSGIPTLMGQASPRPVHRGLTVPKSPVTQSSSLTPPTSKRSTDENKSLRSRKGYPVFPGSSMLNKSLPRRKRSLQEQVQAAETTKNSTAVV
ncbi:unnamed protein product [Auanema sp. JU1783]|nr:unnamed protein product [Auanema sp. JU1783]